jgi:hypothetical protein
MPQEPIFFLGYCAHDKLEHMFDMSGFTLSEATYSLFNTSNIQIHAILQWNLCAAWVRRSQPKRMNSEILDSCYTRHIYHYRWFLSGQPEVKVHFFCGIFSDGPRAKPHVFASMLELGSHALRDLAISVEASVCVQFPLYQGWWSQLT